MVSLYKVTLSHSAGLLPIWLAADNHDEAIAKACEHEKAPLSAVVSWDEATREEAARWSRVLGIR
jgi:hypothetical protein